MQAEVQKFLSNSWRLNASKKFFRFQVQWFILNDCKVVFYSEGKFVSQAHFVLFALMILYINFEVENKLNKLRYRNCIKVQL